MNASSTGTLPLSEEDEALLHKRKEKAWIRFLRLYGPLSLFLWYTPSLAPFLA
jgi:hypothetical protein